MRERAERERELTPTVASFLSLCCALARASSPSSAPLLQVSSFFSFSLLFFFCSQRNCGRFCSSCATPGHRKAIKHPFHCRIAREGTQKPPGAPDATPKTTTPHQRNETNLFHVEGQSGKELVVLLAVGLRVAHRRAFPRSRRRRGAPELNGERTVCVLLLLLLKITEAGDRE